MTRDEAWSLANQWIASWNARDLDAIMTHYDDAVELTSPLAARLLGAPGGKVQGKANLRAYFQRGLEVHTSLHFHLEEVFWGINSVVVYFTDHTQTRVAEFMEMSAAGKVARVVAKRNA